MWNFYDIYKIFKKFIGFWFIDFDFNMIFAIDSLRVTKSSMGFNFGVCMRGRGVGGGGGKK